MPAYPCDICGTVYRCRILAALCCDQAAQGDED